MAPSSFFVFCTWIVLLVMIHTSLAKPLCHQDESSALMEFKLSLRTHNTIYHCAHPKAESWSLDRSGDCCSWDGVKCDEATGHVIGLDLGESCLFGNISSNTSLFRLLHLKSLNLASNDFNFSPMPSGFGNLSGLQYLNLSYSYFTGKVPSDMLRLSRLSSLDLSNWLLEMPDVDNFVRNLTMLKEIDLSSISMQSQFPRVLANFSSLKSLKLADCELHGEFPVSIFQLPNLEVLDISGNFNLFGFIPELHWGSPLKSLDLGGTNFSGEMPVSIGNLVFLNELTVSYCHFSGLLPSPLGNLSELANLDISYNKFHGHIPVSFANLTQMSYLDLSSNNFTGDIWNRLFKLSKLTTLRLSGVQLSGPIPSSFENLTRLVELDLSNNSLEGGISLENLTQLVDLDLSDNHLEGGISLENLTRLVKLDLSFNCLKGEIPNSLPEYLQFLDLRGNNLSGIGDLHKLKNLTELYLASNNMSFIGGTEMNATLPKLFLLSLQSCDLQEFPKFLAYLSGLEQLDLSNNKIRGSIPTWMGIGSRESLVELYLSNNYLEGEIPNSLSELRDLQFLDLGQNNLSGIRDLHKLKNLTWLYLGFNNMSFIGGTEMNATLPKLSTLSLRSCNLQEFPKFLAYLSGLEWLDLSNNKIRGSIPTWMGIGSRESLVELDLSNNYLEGEIPNSLSELRDLQFLDLGQNNLSGIGDLHKLKNLTWLYLGFNNMSFIGGTEMNATLPKLSTLSLRSCNLQEFPKFLAYLSGLEWLDLSNNKIRGSIPTWMGNGSRESLKWVDLSHNFLTGFENKQFNLPLPNLTYLDISSNSLQMELPTPPPSIEYYVISNNSLFGEIQSICRAKSLVVLDLSSNSLNGTIPPCVGNIKSLSVLNLGKNKFEGMIPHPYQKGCALEIMDLTENRLQGPIPRSLVHCTMLEYLNLGYNQIADGFPLWLSKLTELNTVILKSNKFHGPIETHGRQFNFSNMHVMDLSHNDFSGELPSKLLQSFHAMKGIGSQNQFDYYMGAVARITLFTSIYNYYVNYDMKLINKGTEREYSEVLNAFMGVDLSHNKFEGCLPNVIGDLKSLIFLNMSNNVLIGPIPPSLANLTNLESLDLSRNNLLGEIPPQLAQLTFLSSFDVSHNQLWGPIPRGTQFSTFPIASFAMNEGLCGSPLPKKCPGAGDTLQSPPSPGEEIGEDSPFVLDRTFVLIGAGVGFLIGVVLGNLIIDEKSGWFLHYSKRMARRWKRSGRH